MKVGYKGDYALKAVFYLSLRYAEDPGGVISIHELAKLGDMPTKFLEQILLALRRGGFVRSKRGINGGFFLARPPREITVSQVIRYIAGPIEPIDCVSQERYGGCKDTANCIFRDMWRDVKNAISIIIDTLTFEELVFRHKKKRLKFSYEYAI